MPRLRPAPRLCPTSKEFPAYQAATCRHAAILFWLRELCLAATTRIPSGKRLRHCRAGFGIGRETVLPPSPIETIRRRPGPAPDAIQVCWDEVARPRGIPFQPGAFLAAQSNFPRGPGEHAPNPGRWRSASRSLAWTEVRWLDRDSRANQDRSDASPGQPAGLPLLAGN